MRRNKTKMHGNHGFIVGVAPGVREYTINGVKYIVESRFEPKATKVNIADRMKKYLISDFAHLQDMKDSDTIKAENVCLTAGKED